MLACCLSSALLEVLKPLRVFLAPSDPRLQIVADLSFRHPVSSDEAEKATFALWPRQLSNAPRQSQLQLLGPETVGENPSLGQLDSAAKGSLRSWMALYQGSDHHFSMMDQGSRDYWLSYLRNHQLLAELSHSEESGDDYLEQMLSSSNPPFQGHPSHRH